MKFATLSKSIVLGLGLLLASSAFATTKGSFQLSDPVSVNGTTLKAGDYKVQWDGDGPNVEVSILKGKNIVAKVPAHVVELQMPARDDAAVVRTSDSGPGTLSSLHFEGKKIALAFDEANTAMQGGSSK